MATPRPLLRLLVVPLAMLVAVGLGAQPSSAAQRVRAVGAENEYANVIAQIGGRYVGVTGILTNPNTDPHTFESSPADAQEVGSARLIVQNGLGYDTFMNNMERASPNPARRVITVQSLLGLPDDTPNPHLWYSPRTMPAVARAIESDLASLLPSHAAYFEANLTRFDRSLAPWTRAITAFGAAHRGFKVAVTEPVADDLLKALGADIKTPFRFQADVMNGVDPAPQDISLQTNLLAGHGVAVLVYNQQIVDSLTRSFLSDARAAGVPVVGVYETMPSGYDYQRWMLAEVRAIAGAVLGHRSTQKL